MKTTICRIKHTDGINGRSDIEEKISEFEDNRNYPASWETLLRNLIFSKFENYKPTDPGSSTNFRTRYMKETHKDNIIKLLKKNDKEKILSSQIRKDILYTEKDKNDIRFPYKY